MVVHRAVTHYVTEFMLREAISTRVAIDHGAVLSAGMVLIQAQVIGRAQKLSSSSSPSSTNFTKGASFTAWELLIHKVTPMIGLLKLTRAQCNEEAQSVEAGSAYLRTVSLAARFCGATQLNMTGCGISAFMGVPPTPRAEAVDAVLTLDYTILSPDNQKPCTMQRLDPAWNFTRLSADACDPPASYLGYA